jgi:hypothetical protein
MEFEISPALESVAASQGMLCVSETPRRSAVLTDAQDVFCLLLQMG